MILTERRIEVLPIVAMACVSDRSTSVRSSHQGWSSSSTTNASGAAHYYFNDHLGAPILQTDATGAVVWRVERDPYGERYATRVGGERHQPLGLPGQEYDASSDRQYNINRWYRSSWGRYTTADPLGRAYPALYWQQNRPHEYSYGALNPVRFVDPLGLKPCCDCPEQWWSYKGVVGGIGLLVGITYQQGTYTCVSKPDLQVSVKTTCIQKGLFANIGLSGATSVTPLGIPGAKACYASELTDPDPKKSLFGGGKYGAGADGDINSGTGTVSLGLAFGLGFGGQDCQTNVWQPTGSRN